MSKRSPRPNGLAVPGTSGLALVAGGLLLIALRGASALEGPLHPREAERPADAATLSGRVTVASDPPSPPVTLSPYARRRYEPPQDPGTPGGSEDAFVYLIPMEGPAPAPGADPVRIYQRERTILPHVSVARVGQVVEFPNEDDIFHNLFSLSPGNRFSLGRYAPGVTETNVFETAGVVRLFCDIHAEMAGVILVVDTPWVTRVGADGRYSVTGLPAGRYRAIAWHPTSRPDTLELDLEDGTNTTRDFSLSPGE